jgi:putative transposase
VFVTPTEEEATWNAVFSDLLERGLDAREVRCIASDEHKGLRKAMRRYVPKVNWQRCQTHYQRNAAGKVPRKAREEVHARLRDIFNAPDEERAWQRARRLMEDWRNRFPGLVDWMEETLEDTLAVFALPKEHRTRMRTNNGLERFHEEIRRRSRVVRIFPNRDSCLRLCSALSMEQSEDWLTGHRYLNMEVLAEESIKVTEPLRLAVAVT